MSELHPILQFFVHYGYWIVIPIMILEGPIITIIMGFLASFGLFNIFIVIALGAFSDLISDAIYYYSGYHGGPKVLDKLKLPQLHRNDDLKSLRARFNDHPGKIFFGAKVLTGVAHTTFVLAGVTRINYEKILRYSVPGGIVWSTGLAALGYYAGKHATDITRFLTWTGIILFSTLALFLIYKFWFGKFLARKYAVWRQSNGN